LTENVTIDAYYAKRPENFEFQIFDRDAYMVD